MELQYITERHCRGKTQYRLAMHVQYTAQDATKIIIACVCFWLIAPYLSATPFCSASYCLFKLVRITLHNTLTIDFIHKILISLNIIFQQNVVIVFFLQNTQLYTGYRHLRLDELFLTVILTLNLTGSTATEYKLHLTFFSSF